MALSLEALSQMEICELNIEFHRRLKTCLAIYPPLSWINFPFVLEEVSRRSFSNEFCIKFIVAGIFEKTMKRLATALERVYE